VTSTVRIHLVHIHLVRIHLVRIHLVHSHTRGRAPGPRGYSGKGTPSSSMHGLA